MAYQLLLRGQLIGETDLDYAGPGATQRLAFFHPTDRGRRELPRITGLMRAAFALKVAMERQGLDPDDMPADAVVDLLDRTMEGRRVVEVVKALDALELRDERGARLTFTAIAVSDLDELRDLCRDLRTRSVVPDTADVPESHRFLISATLTPDVAARLPAPRHVRLPEA